MVEDKQLKLVPILVGVGVVAASAIVAKLLLDMKKKKKVTFVLIISFDWTSLN